jgi:hypothetical protein
VSEDTNAEVAKLARWLHQVVRKRNPNILSWRKTSPAVKLSYGVLARRLLVKPPAALRRRIAYLALRGEL